MPSETPAPEATTPTYETLLADADAQGRAIADAHHLYVTGLKTALEAHRLLVDDLSAAAASVPGGGYRSTPWSSLRQLPDAELLAQVDGLAADDAARRGRS